MESSLEEVFNAFMGGYWGPSYYFYINKVKDGYQFRYGYDKYGCIINNTIIGIITRVDAWMERGILW